MTALPKNVTEVALRNLSVDIANYSMDEGYEADQIDELNADYEAYRLENLEVIAHELGSFNKAQLNAIAVFAEYALQNTFDGSDTAPDKIVEAVKGAIAHLSR